jgi:hypothetical protein
MHRAEMERGGIHTAQSAIVATGRKWFRVGLMRGEIGGVLPGLSVGALVAALLIR